MLNSETVMYSLIGKTEEFGRNVHIIFYVWEGGHTVTLLFECKTVQ